MAENQTISEVIDLIEHGKFASDCGHELKKLLRTLERVAEEGGSAKGDITIKLGVKLTGSGTVKFSPSVTVKEPGTPRNEQILFTAKDGVLVAENPKQQKLPLRQVPKAEGGNN